MWPWGGAAGSALRYVIATYIQARSGSPFPVGTLMVNISGSILLGHVGLSVVISLIAMFLGFAAARELLALRRA